MNEYNLRERAAKLERLIQQHQQEATQIEERLASFSDKPAPPVPDILRPPVLIDAEKALNSNSAFLMRQRASALHEATQPIFQRACDLEKAGDAAGCRAWSDRGCAWEAVRRALEARATLLESRAAEKQAEAVSRKENRERRAREREEAEAGLRAQRQYREQVRKCREDA